MSKIKELLTPEQAFALANLLKVMDVVQHTGLGDVMMNHEGGKSVEPFFDHVVNFTAFLFDADPEDYKLRVGFVVEDKERSDG